MKNTIGLPVRGDDFFKRDTLINQAWSIIESGAHILIAAPRRVGKTSLMRYLEDHPRKGYSFLYVITESVSNENEFFRRILNKLLQTDYVKQSQRAMTFIKTHIPKIKKVGPDGIEFGVRGDYDYKGLFEETLTSCSQEEKKLLIMIDEFPQTLENIINNEGKEAGVHFLQSNREIRQDSDITNKIQFIYTGSIGLENIVGRLNAAKAINDLARIAVPPLSMREAKELIRMLCEEKEFTLPEEISEYILKEIEWLIPSYIQLIIFEIGNIYDDQQGRSVSKQVVDSTIDRMIECRNQFEHWEQRLRSSLSMPEYTFVKEFLNIVSEKGVISSNEIYDLSVKQAQQETYKALTDSLVYDGYVTSNDSGKTYRFNSPILRKWWRENVAN